MTAASLKHHYALAPLFLALGAGCILCTAQCMRSLLRNPDVTWKKDQHPQNEYATKSYKVFNPSGYDYSQGAAQRPNYRD